MTTEFKPLKISDIEVGDRVLLEWDGYEGVPKYLTNTWAEVVAVKRTRVVVKPNTIVGTQSVRFQQIAKICKQVEK